MANPHDTPNEAIASDDLISLDDPTTPAPVPSSGDSVLNAASVFEAQLEQMTAWKHQLASQMELLRRDGIKILERQKNLAIEKKKLAEEREQLATDRQYVQKLHREVDESNSALTERTNAFKKQQTEIESARHEFGLREAEFNAREKSFQEREAQFLANDVRVKENFEQLEGQRKQLLEAEVQLKHDREAIAQQQKQLEEVRAAQACQQERWNALEARAAEMAMQEEASSKKLAEIATREEEIRKEKRSVDAAQGELLAAQEKLIAGEKALNEQRASLASDLQTRLTAAQQSQQQLEEERQTFLKQRQELQKKIEALENDHAEQLDVLAKQTKRLAERRAELESHAGEIDKDANTKVAKAIASANEEAARIQQQHQARIAELEKQLQQNQAASTDSSTREKQLHRDVEAASEQIAQLKRDLTAATTNHADADRERTELTRLLADQVMRYEKDAAEWQRKLNDAITEAKNNPSAPDLQQAIESAQAAKDELEQWRTKAQQLEAAQSQSTADLAKQISLLEAQRNELAAQLLSGQDALKRHSQDALLSKNASEAQLTDLRQQLSSLEAEKSAWQSSPKPATPASSSEETAAVNDRLSLQRDRLLRQARTLRAYRKQVREGKNTQNSNFGDLAQQREQLRVRKENLEQVKRLLEKQEMVMARKLADHNALKTVAAVGIFVIMIIASVFLGVYKFINPVFRSEAVVQLAAPLGPNSAPLQGAELQSWVNHQLEQAKANEVTFAAWKVLRSGDEHYNMHDVREEWLASFPRNLTVQLDAPSRSIAFRYTGPNADGVAEVSNALALAFISPTNRENSPQTADVGMGATILARATPAMYPLEDNRLMISLSGVAILLFVSLVFVILFRHYVARQLREIDEMADEKDLEEIQSELPAEVEPTPPAQPA